MYIFLIIGIIFMAAGAWMYWRGRKWKKENIVVLETHYKDKLDKQFQDYRQQIQEKIEIEEQRAIDAFDHTEELIQQEKKRINIELEAQNELKCMELKQKYDQMKNELAAIYVESEDKLRAEYVQLGAQLNEEYQQKQAEVEEFRAIVQAINEESLRRKEMEDKESFYSIDISENDQQDIQALLSMDLKLHNRDVIPKLVWDLFVKRPCQEMCKRITGGRKISGIYKITNKKTGEAYVGKTTDFTTRWQNHCKTALGLEGCARTTLHNRLAQDGLWNYTWEILEQVDKDHLSTREAFYIDLYDTTKQLNMKQGDKNGTQ